MKLCGGARPHLRHHSQDRLGPVRGVEERGKGTADGGDRGQSDGGGDRGQADGGAGEHSDGRRRRREQEPGNHVRAWLEYTDRLEKNFTIYPRF